MQTLNGCISLNLICTASGKDGFVLIEVEDERSSCKALEAKVSIEDFLHCLMRGHPAPCSFIFNKSGLIGKKIQSKRELVPLEGREFYALRQADIRELLEPFEMDGWRASEEDMENHHNYDPKALAVLVRFRRWISESETKEAKEEDGGKASGSPAS